MKYTHAIKLHHNGLVKKIPGTDKWIVQESFVWYIDYENKQGKIEVEKGFVTNFGSIPKILRPFIDKTEYVGYILHDKLWSKGAYIELGTHKMDISFKDSNEMLLEAIKTEGAGFIERWLVYIGLQYTIIPYFHFKNCKGL